MISIAITEEARALLEAHAIGQMVGGIRLPDGRFAIDVEDDVHAMLVALDPDMSMAVKLACSKQFGRA